MLNKDTLSYTNDYIKNVEKYYNITPLRGQFDMKDFNFLDQLFNTVDFNKAYTSNLQDMKYFPVFTIFDLWKEYDNHIVNVYYQYIVECKPAYNNYECQIVFKKDIVDVMDTNSIEIINIILKFYNLENQVD